LKKLHIAIVVSIIILAVLLMANAVMNPPAESELNQRIRELNEAGCPTEDFPGSFAEAKAQRQHVTFEEITSWTTFKQHVAETLLEHYSVMVWVHRDEGIMWVARYQTTYYYIKSEK